MRSRIAAMASITLETLQQQIRQREQELQQLRQELESRQSQLSELTRRKEELRSELQQIEAEIAALATARGPAKFTTATPMGSVGKSSIKSQPRLGELI